MKIIVIKIREIIVIQTLSFLLIFLCGGFAYGNSVKISSPKNGEKVGARVIVKGTSSIKDSSHIWVLAHAKLLQDQWWPQPKPVVDVKGNWQALCYIGAPRDIGLDFEIAVATFDKEAEAEILKYFDYGNKTGQWLPISFPKTTSSIDIVTVNKVSH